MAEMMKNTCDAAQKMVDCYTKEPEFCACTCAQTVGADGDVDKDCNEKPDMTVAEMVEEMVKGFNAACKDADAVKSGCAAD